MPAHAHIAQYKTFVSDDPCRSTMIMIKLLNGKQKYNGVFCVNVSISSAWICL